MDQDGNSNWKYTPGEDSEQPEPSSKSASSEVSWQAAEFIEHPHGAGWYGLLGLVTIALTVVVYLLTKDIFATATIPVVGIIVGAFAGHKAGVAQYEISSSGMSVNGKNYPYGLFKSFSILREGSLSSVNLFPMKRFMPPVSAYFESAQEEKIANALGSYLPYEERQMDAVDKLSRRLRL
jgi:hypothetical protein